MTERAILWPIAGTTSVTMHLLFLAGLMLVLRPDELPPQQMPKARIDITPHQVERVDALETTAQGDMAAKASADTTNLSGTAIPVSKSKTIPTVSEVVALTTASSTIAADLTATGPNVEAAQSLSVSATAVSATNMISTQLTPLTGSADALASVSPIPSAIQTMSPATISGAPVVSQKVQGSAGVELKAETPTLPDSPVAAIAEPAGLLPPPAEFATAALAWSGSETIAADPLSLAAVQAFMPPSDLDGTLVGTDSLRDGIAETLNGVPCARLQTVFQPETGTLELRGHVPEDALRIPVMAALREHIGGAIPIADRLLVLPRPQCQALSGIAAIGLAQSTEQSTNPRVVGFDAFVRVYNYSSGQRLVLDLQAPDYASFIYVDYFDAQGNVLHIQPNQTIPLERVEPKSILAIGQDRPDKPSINLTISPPYGQEIAVAFAASSPLYEEPRPLIEPAAPYLEFLRHRVATRRNEIADFKGEWVYFFINTSPD